MEVLTLKNVTLDDAGEYTCLAGNSIGVSYHSAWLTVVNGKFRWICLHGLALKSFSLFTVASLISELPPTPVPSQTYLEIFIYCLGFFIIIILTATAVICRLCCAPKKSDFTSQLAVQKLAKSIPMRRQVMQLLSGFVATLFQYKNSQIISTPLCRYRLIPHSPCSLEHVWCVSPVSPVQPPLFWQECQSMNCLMTLHGSFHATSMTALYMLHFIHTHTTSTHPIGREPVSVHFIFRSINVVSFPNYNDICGALTTGKCCPWAWRGPWIMPVWPTWTKTKQFK